MPSKRLVTLLTDFGLNDIYAAAMKGVIAQINPDLTIVDLTHNIAPQNINSAQFNLINAYPYFPEGTVHVAVVDPGVGGVRRAVAIELETGFLVGPDNGIFTSLLDRYSAKQVIELDNPSYWRNQSPSPTFHGRDIFAPVAAHLASGVPFHQLGSPLAVETLMQRPIPACMPTATGFMGSIQHIDRFGNVITNIPGDYVKGKSWSVALRNGQLPGCQTYGDVQPQKPLALIGSHGWIEIAVNGGDAQFQLRLNWSDPIEVTLE